MDDQRDSVPRRSADRALLEWRGQITEQVRAHERKFGEINGDLRDLRKEVTGLRNDMVGMGGQITEARNDIGETVMSLSKSRDDEMRDLHSAIREAKVTGRDVLQWFVVPLAVLVIGTLLIALIVGHGHF